MLKHVDHIAYVVRDLREGIATLSATFDLAVTREVELAEFSLVSAFLGEYPTAVEVVEFLSPEIAESRLGGLALRLDHVAYDVASIEHAAAQLRTVGVRFSGPDGVEVEQPIELGGARHLWTMPGGSPLGLCLQLVERPV